MTARRSFFKSLALIGAAAVGYPSVFIPKFEAVRWKRETHIVSIVEVNPEWINAPFITYFLFPNPDPAELDENRLVWAPRYKLLDGQYTPIHPYIVREEVRRGPRPGLTQEQLEAFRHTRLWS